MENNSVLIKLPYFKKIRQELRKSFYLQLYGPKRQSKRTFKKTFGYALDLKNPKTFSEKICALKLDYANDENAILAGDKIGVHQYIASKNLKSLAVPLIAAVDSFKEVDWEALPQQFVIKKSNASALNLIVKDKAKIAKEEVQQLLNDWQYEEYGLSTAEPHYSKMIGKFIIEEYVPELEHDWKIFFFNGVPKVVELYAWEDETDVLIGHRKTVYITTDMQGKVLYVDQDPGLPASEEEKYKQLESVELPKEFAEMVAYGTKLAEGFPFVRVDFFIGNKQLYLSELSFTPGAGLHPYQPEFDLWLGELLEMPKR
ncbi:MAG: ATP-grasp fold amidoligase family protein [Enterococcus sp.]